MAFSTQRSVSDGTLVSLALSIEYFDRTEITVFFDGILSAPESGLWAWLGTTDKVINFTPAVADGVEVMFARNTALVEPRHQYTKGAQFIAETLDENFTQALRIVQEAKEGSGMSDVFNDLDLHGFKIRNVGAAVEPTDVITLAQYQADAAGASAAKIAAEGYAANAFTYKGEAAASAASALADKNTATTQAGLATTNGAAQVALATTQVGLATTQAGLAATAKTDADSARDLAVTARAGAEAAFDSFDDRYLGAKAVAPTLDNDGNALLTGALYFDTVIGAGTWRAWNGSAWITAPVADASTVVNTPAGGISATTVQAAINELDTEKALISQLGGFNRIINGDMRLDTWNVGAAITPTAAGVAYVVDRWVHYQTAAGSKFTSQRVPSVGSSHAFSILLISTANTTPASTDANILVQAIEGYNVGDLRFGTANAKSITVQFEAKSNMTGTHSGSIRNGDNTRAYPFTFSIPVADVVTPITVVIPGDTAGVWAVDHISGMQLAFNLGSGSSFLGTAGAWAADDAVGATGSVNLCSVAGAYLAVTGVQLASGSIARPFNARPITVEQTLCLRYAYKADNLDIGRWASNVECRIYYQHPVPMRVNPVATLLTQSCSIEETNILNHTCTNASITAATTTARAYVNFLATWSGTGAVAGNMAQVNAGGLLRFNAELI